VSGSTQTFENRQYRNFALFIRRYHLNEFYKKGCQEKSSASTGVGICVSRSSPLSIGCAAMSFGFRFS
jgi:hypothetical protein